MLYEKNEVARMIKAYGNLRGCETYLINELRKPRQAIDIARAKGVADDARIWIEIYKTEYPKEIRDELANIWSLEELVAEADKL